jgi:Ni,Fe-hydrogenase III large subunit/Ni,Fe-hydrogenase III component G
MTVTARRDVSRDDLPAAAEHMLADGWRLALVAAHEDDPDAFRIVYAFLRPVAQRTELHVSIPRDDAWLPTLAGISHPAGRFEREMRDLYGIRPEGHPQPRRLVRHGHWPTGWYPMRADAGPSPQFGPDLGSYPFIPVTGDGVYEIPVGPIHAGLIEPGHFRFWVVGETILRMKARLWFLHRGVEGLFGGRAPGDGIELAERISGDTAVGHTLAYLMAVEDALGIDVDDSARATRALLLELERLYNHVNDIGAIANDVGYGIAHAHTQRLRETLLRHNKTLTGHRLLRGGLWVGGAGVRTEPDLDLLRRVAGEVAEIVAIALDHPVVSDRFTGTAVLPREQATHLDVLGYVARASGRDIDARRDHPLLPLDGFTPVLDTSGDVLARFTVRAREIQAGVALVEDLTARSGGPLAPAPTLAPTPGSRASGLGVVEAWRGTLCTRVELAPDGTLTRVKVVDPSWFNWPALPIALNDTIVPDFPLANKSFNQSYAGNDL